MTVLYEIYFSIYQLIIAFDIAKKGGVGSWVLDICKLTYFSKDFIAISYVIYSPLKYLHYVLNDSAGLFFLSLYANNAPCLLYARLQVSQDKIKYWINVFVIH